MKSFKIYNLFLVLLYTFITSCNTENVYRNNKGEKAAIISFIFDDLNTSDTLVKNIFDEFDLKPSFAILSNRLNSKSASIYKSYNDQGISVLSHSVSHPRMNDSLTQKDVINLELKQSKEAIEKHGIKVSGFVTPFSYMHPNFLELLESYYAYAFTNNSKGKYDKTVSKYKLSRYGIESNISRLDHTINSIKSRIDSAIVKKELLVLYGHELPSRYKDDKGQTRVNSNDLRHILNYLKQKQRNKECFVLTTDAAILEYYK